jgi:hypothetical protein
VRKKGRKMTVALVESRKVIERPPLWEITFKEQFVTSRLVDGFVQRKVDFKPSRTLLVYDKSKKRALERAMKQMGNGQYVVIGQTAEGACARLVEDHGPPRPNAAQK